MQLSNVGFPTILPFHQMTIKTNYFDRILAKIYRDAAISFLFTVDVMNDRKDYTNNFLTIGLDTSTMTVLR